ncbi:MAG: methyltransferase domain-containing protein [Myxococcota bacterium]
MSSSDGWSPETYARFASHRTAPFEALLELVSPCPGGSLLDLGCGTGALTTRAHARLGVASSLGLDSSAAMLDAGQGTAGVTLERRELPQELPADRRFDRVLSNSAFNWLPDHRALLPRVLALVAPGGELAVQMPSNQGTPFSDAALEAATAFSRELDGWVYRSPVEPPELYAELLARDARVVSSRVGTWYFPQLHPSVDGLVDFARGGLLSGYRARLPAGDFERFCAAYRAGLARRLGDGPVFFAFRRLFLFAKVA